MMKTSTPNNSCSYPHTTPTMAALDPMYSVSECPVGPVGMPASIGEYFPSWGSSTAPPSSTSTASTSSAASSYTETPSYPYATATATATAPMEYDTPTYPHMTPTEAALDPLFSSSERPHSTAMVRAVPKSLKYQNYLGLSGINSSNNHNHNTIRRSPNTTPYVSQAGSSYVPRVDPYVTTGSSGSNPNQHGGNGGSGPYSFNTRNHLQALQDRDDEFVRGLPQEIIAEQHRILSSIKSRSSRNEGNRNTNNNTNNDDHTGKSTLSSASSDSYIAEQQAALDLYRRGSTNSHSAGTEGNRHGPGEPAIARPVASSSAALVPSEIHPRRFQMKKERRAKTAVSATTGAIVGGLLTGPAWPLGAAAGAAVGGYAGKVTARAGERRAQRDWEKRNVDAYVKTGAAGVQRNTVAYC